MNIVIFEDHQYVSFLPLVYFRPVWELRCGAGTLEENMKRYLDGDYYYQSREYLLSYYLPEEQNFRNLPGNSEALFVNGRWLLTKSDAERLRELASGEALISENTLLAFRATSSILRDLPDFEEIADKLKTIKHKAHVAGYLWDLIDWNGEQLVTDFQLLDRGGEIEGAVSPGVHILEEQYVHIANDAQVKPGVVIDASEGPVWIDEGAVIMANAVLEGPIYIGKKSRIKIGAKLYENTTVGPVCKIGGEVEESIIQGYSNKQHDGFLGHAYLGQWVNLGADTNNSDLKNNYGEIRVLLNGREMDTGKQFLGLMMGDHSKTAINTMFNTGTIVGVNCNIFGAGMPPRFVPSFSWGGAEKMVEYRLDKIIEVAKKVMGRRNVSFTDKEEKLFVEVKNLAKEVEKVTVR